MPKEIYLPPAELEAARLPDEPERDPVDDVLTDLCRQEIEHWLSRIGARSEDRLIIWLWCRGLKDREIAEGLRKYFPLASESLTVAALTKRRQRLLYLIEKKAGVDLGLITVIRAAFKRDVH